MRCKIGDRKLKRLRDKYRINFVRGLTRGNTYHRIDLWDENGNEYFIYPTRSIQFEWGLTEEEDLHYEKGVLYDGSNNIVSEKYMIQELTNKLKDKLN